MHDFSHVRSLPSADYLVINDMFFSTNCGVVGVDVLPLSCEIGCIYIRSTFIYVDVLSCLIHFNHLLILPGDEHISESKQCAYVCF